jgi:DNA-binding transcriptional ArsR family regulator
MKCQAYHLFFSHLANELKNDIIVALRKEEMNVTRLSKVLKVEQSKLSHALASLKCCKVVNVEQRGKERVYSLNKKTIVPILKLIDKHAVLNCGTKGCSCQDKK